MILPMKQVSIIAGKSELKAVIDVLKETASFEITAMKPPNGAAYSAADDVNKTAYNAANRGADKFADTAEAEHRTALAALLMRADGAIEFIKKHSGDEKQWTRRTELDYTDLKDLDETAACEVLEHLEDIKARQDDVNSAIALNNDKIAELTPYINLPMKFAELCDTKTSFVVCGLIPASNAVRLKKKAKQQNIFAEYIAADRGHLCAVLVGHKSDCAFLNDLGAFHFEHCKFSFDKTAAELIAELKSQNDRLTAEVNYTILAEHYSATQDNVRILKHYRDYLANEIDTYDIMMRTAGTKKYYVAHGWIVAADEARITDAVYLECPNAIVTVAEAGEDDNPPVVTVNRKIVEPYRQLTAMYGSPSRGDLDPNPFMAPFYFLFFGFMIGDAGYGFVLSILMLLLIRIKKPQGDAKNMMRLFCAGGVSAMLWGLVFSSFFGYSLYPALFDPMNKAIEFLVLAFSLGFIHILFAIGLNAYNAWRKGHIADAILDSVMRIVMLLSLLVFGLGIMVSLPWLTISGTSVFGISLVTVFLTNGRKKKGLFGKIAGGVSGAYSLVGYFSDIMSYARLFGLALVGAVIAMAGNSIGAMLYGIPYVGVPLGILIASVFHAFNLGLGVLSAYVHGARLQFVEFFSKFYTGEGRAFAPAAAALKYTKLKVHKAKAPETV